ncbi:somatostatin receptor type 5-like [Lytechinus variegatus]|uniref:somatostatin receptor type 5-like n=1 Tax=Lytechinus variegatus TaxID=7654 RepID=UPI001BB14C87|nr:somatostatin receptor type 5-like [Lytechinus variegatus]
MSFPPLEISISTDDLSNGEMQCTEVLNLTKEDDAESYGYSRGETFYVTAFLPLVLTLGVLDNSAFIYVVFRVPRMQTSINCYLLNLAVADIVFLLSGIGEKIWRFRGSPILGDDNPLGQGGCVWVYLVMDTAYFASLCFVSLVSIDRYCAVCRPRQRYVQCKPKTTMLTVGSWLTSMCLSSALIPSNTNLTQVCLVHSDSGVFVDWPTRWGICTPTKPWMKAYANGMQTIPFFSTLIVNVTMFVLIVRGLNRSIERLQSHSEGEAEVDTHMRDRIARMLVINGVAFFVCLAPFEIISFADMISSVRGDAYPMSSDAQAGLLYFSRSLAYINCVINPIIYTVMSHRYRLAFKQAFHLGAAASPVCTSTATKFVGSTTNEYLRVSLDTRV